METTQLNPRRLFTRVVNHELDGKPDHSSNTKKTLTDPETITASGGNLEQPEDGSKVNVYGKSAPDPDAVGAAPKPPKPDDKPLPKGGADGPRRKRSTKELVDAAAGLSEEGTVSTLDVVLGIAFVMTLLFAIDQVRRWRADRGYIKVMESPQAVEPLLMTQV